MNFLIIYYDDGSKRYFGCLNIKFFEVGADHKIKTLTLFYETNKNEVYESYSKILQGQKSWELI